ncbi:ABC-F family regulatory ATPase [Bacteroidales bacterium]|nr:ABC-F family regulatory ATPase [Bacteroidales bacterium]
MFSAEKLSVAFGGFTLLDEISFVVDKKDRIALVGKNGAGKSTLLKIFAGLSEPSSGRVSMPKDVTIGYLAQQMKVCDDKKVIEEASLAFEHIQEMENKICSLQNELASRTDYETASYHKLIDKLSHLNEQLLMEGGGNFQAEVERTLIGLGFQRSDFERPTSEFSGGWRMRIELAKLLLRRPDILLLDEPTNHLDIESIQWLENFLAIRSNAVILVSHDKAFIDAVTQRTIEISLGKVYDYRVNYSKYVVLRKERREQQQRAFENQQKQIGDTEAFIERFRYKSTKSVQVQSRIKQLDKIDRIEVDEEDNAALRLKFPPAPRSGAYPIITENLAKTYDKHLVFANASLTINRGEKVAFVGKNGEGKSTLVKCIMQEIDYAGKLQLGHNVKIGYFAQNQADVMDEKLSVFETIDNVAVGDIRSKIRDILGAFMFGGEASDKKVAVLSGGERTRLAMIKLLLEPVNLLILDEPTNHLDMKTKDILKEALREFEGTIILVSHDRDFLEGLVDKVYEFGDKKVIEHLGGIYEFLQKKKMQNFSELEKKANSLITPKENQEVNNNNGEKIDAKLSYEERKEQQRAFKRLEKKIEQTEGLIETLEDKIKNIEIQLTDSEAASDLKLVVEHTNIQTQIEQTMEQWSNLTSELELLQNDSSN